MRWSVSLLLRYYWSGRHGCTAVCLPINCLVNSMCCMFVCAWMYACISRSLSLSICFLRCCAVCDLSIWSSVDLCTYYVQDSTHTSFMNNVSGGRRGRATTRLPIDSALHLHLPTGIFRFPPSLPVHTTRHIHMLNTAFVHPTHPPFLLSTPPGAATRRDIALSQDISP